MEPKKETKWRKYKYIKRVLVADHLAGCMHCGWQGTVADTNRDDNHPTTRMAMIMGTTQFTERDLYCPNCGHHIISYPIWD